MKHFKTTATFLFTSLLFLPHGFAQTATEVKKSAQSAKPTEFTKLVTKGAPQKSTLSLEDYLEQVQNNNPAFQASKKGIEATKLRESEGNILLSPKLGIQAMKVVDKSQQNNVNASGVKNSTNQYKVSLIQDTSFGLRGTLSYGHNYFKVDGASSAFVPFDEYYRVSPKIELSQSLLKNSFGSEFRATKKAMTAQAQAQYYSEKAKNTGLLIAAQNAYYGLYYASLSEQAVKESLQNAKTLNEWAQGRLKKGIGEESDFLQTKTVYEIRQIEYAAAKQTVETAILNFNLLRGSDSKDSSLALDGPTLSPFEKKNFNEGLWRDDVRALQKQTEALRAQSQLNVEKNKPELNLVASYALNGFDPSSSEAKKEALKNDYPAYSVGVMFSIPLNLSLSSKLRDGYRGESLSKDLELQFKLKEQMKDYQDLVQKIETASLKLKLSKTLLESQKKKSQVEQARHKKGRTTFFQVLQFEQDYLDSKLNEIKTEAELTSALTQLQLYRGEQ